MTKYTKQIVSVIASSVMLLNIATPALAATTITVTGNGTDSTNNVHVEQGGTTNVSQNNTAHVTNNIDSNSSTGGNDANKNTGGSVSVDTGNASNTTNVTNNLNSNAANVSNCNCAGDTTVKIKGNGSDSENRVNLDQGNTTTVAQTNNAVVTNNVDSNASTGGNDANKNTGGSVSVMTGDATTTTTVKTTANSNAAQIGGGSSTGGSLSAVISGNGSDSENKIKLDADNSASIWQVNSANITNDVDASAKTGGNDANKNTGGTVKVDTGNAKTNATVDNNVNFNAANLDCGCLLGVAADVTGNGTDSENKINVDLGGTNTIAQGGTDLGNNATLNNDVDGNAKTGGNDVNSSTGSVMGGDPSVSTGNATNNTGVTNSGNNNVVGSPIDWPTMPGANVSFTFNFSDLMAFLGMHV